MMLRRDLLMGAACAVGLGGASALRPSRNVTLLGSAKLAEMVPAKFGPWRSQDVGDPLAINGPGTLSAKLYNQLVTRVYSNDATGQQVMMLLAYGGKQTDELQLHRPEVCYPAFGYNILRNEPYDISLPGQVGIPARRLVATQEDRTESIIYWSRMGEYLPRDGGEQRTDRLKVAMQGVIPDGLLARFSTIAADPSDPWRDLTSFVPQLVEAVAPAARKVLVGSERGQALAVALPRPVSA